MFSMTTQNCFVRDDVEDEGLVFEVTLVLKVTSVLF